MSKEEMDKIDELNSILRYEMTQKLIENNPSSIHFGYSHTVDGRKLSMEIKLPFDGNNKDEVDFTRTDGKNSKEVISIEKEKIVPHIIQFLLEILGEMAVHPSDWETIVRYTRNLKLKRKGKEELVKFGRKGGGW
jgi:hypothetical protein